MRDGLIDELRREHDAIREHLDLVRTAGLASPEGRRALGGARDLLLDHFAREDRELLPPLARAAAERPLLKQFLELARCDVRAVTTLAIACCDGDDAGLAESARRREFAAFCARLELRLAHEERILFPEFERLAEEQRCVG